MNPVQENLTLHAAYDAMIAACDDRQVRDDLVIIASAAPGKWHWILLPGGGAMGLRADDGDRWSFSHAESQER